MTAIKQVAVTSRQHMKSLEGYLDRSNERHDAIAFDSQNLNNPDDWAKEFDRTREAYGHNRPGRAGAKCTYAYHQIIGFNPDECEMNGGKLRSEDCMSFAKEWVSKYYPNQECAWALHRERCREDGTERYAVHIAINRTNLETGKRLDEGRASRQKTLHASRMAEMDRRYGLAKMERGRRNSRVHARQRTRAEKRASDIGRSKDPAFETDQEHVRRVVRESVEKVAVSSSPNKMRALDRELRARGVHMRLSRDGRAASKDVVFEYRPTYNRRDRRGRPVKIARICGRNLGRGYSLTGIAFRLGVELTIELARMANEDMMRE